MSKKRNRAAAGPNADSAHSTLLIEEDSFDNRSWLRLGAWSLAAISAVTIAMLASQSSFKLRRDEVASNDLSRQAQQMQALNQQTQSEARKLAAAIDTLNSDRDRLYSRVSSLEQGLDSVTGSIGRQAAAATRPSASPADAPPAAPNVAPAETVSPVAPALPPKSDSTASQPAERPADVVASAPPSEPDAIPVARSAFGIDLGIAPSIEGLRALWKQISSAHPALAGLTPLIVIKERPGIAGMQLRLVAGPLRDATSAAQICAALPAGRLCEPASYDGQRLSLGNDTATAPIDAPKPVVKPKPKPKPKPPASPAAAPPAPSTSSSLIRG